MVFFTPEAARYGNTCGSAPRGEAPHVYMENSSVKAATAAPYRDAPRRAAPDRV